MGFLFAFVLDGKGPFGEETGLTKAGNAFLAIIILVYLVNYVTLFPLQRRGKRL